jgi:hypothetical protein
MQADACKQRQAKQSQKKMSTRKRAAEERLWGTGSGTPIGKAIRSINRCDTTVSTKEEA